MPKPGDARIKELLEPSAQAVSVEISAHDASHLEWRALLPLPTEGRMSYSVETSFELPSISLSGHSPWDQLQGFTRLESPHILNGSEPGAPGNAIRQRVLSLQQLLRRAREGVVRHCGMLNVAGKQITRDDSRFLVTWLDTAFAALASARAELAGGKDSDSADIKRERELAEEFVSVRLVDFVAEAQASVDALRPDSAASKRLTTLLASVDQRLAKALDGELNYRKARGYPIADAASPESLERYVERAGRLKKHFESALSLDRESYPIEERIHVWLTVVGAVFAGACAFAMQLYLLNTSNTTRLSWSLIGLTLLMGGTYAARERIKESFRGWITGRVHRSYAQRVVRCFLPENASRNVVVQAREWCHETTRTRPDPLNPEGGASLRVTEVDHLHNGVIAAQPELSQSGVHRLRQLFRYDLSPLFPRLQDPIKRIPVVDADTGRSKFVGAPRRYQMPIRVRVSCGPEFAEARATLVLDKQGIVRLEQTAVPNRPCP